MQTFISYSCGACTFTCTIYFSSYRARKSEEEKKKKTNTFVPFYYLSNFTHSTRQPLDIVFFISFLLSAPATTHTQTLFLSLLSLFMAKRFPAAKSCNHNIHEIPAPFIQNGYSAVRDAAHTNSYEYLRTYYKTHGRSTNCDAEWKEREDSVSRKYNRESFFATHSK